MAKALCSVMPPTTTVSVPPSKMKLTSTHWPVNAVISAVERLRVCKVWTLPVESLWQA